METERLQLTKRHSFPYTKIYTWNMLNSGSQIQVDIPIDQMKSAPVISSDGSSAEREARLEDAILWIRKELSDMRHQDKSLTRQFIQLRATIQGMKDDGLESTETLKEPSFRHSVPGPNLRPSFGRSFSYM
ncbi:PREDICTED: uncharacterized protein LOC107357768 [Acropora digitifera]|uniref:uncharacterized protein LOC107357768 n=1 Tax=Acropora digitifera TaxID=70779 RepID=UPI00077AD971|nr:PREDICTED: uncharacterized protein LOC107357768 [Acropora digitifera]